MSGGEWAGRLRERATVSRPGGRDVIGAESGMWDAIGESWVAAVPIGTGPIAQGDARASLPLWRLEMRDRDLRVGDRIARAGIATIVRSVTRDPALPGRLIAIGEEQR